MERLRSHRSPLLTLGGRVALLALLVSPCFGGTILQQMRLSNFEEAVVVAERVDVGTSAPAVSLPQPRPTAATAPYCAAQVTAETAKLCEGRAVQLTDSLNGGAAQTEIPKCE